MATSTSSILPEQHTPTSSQSATHSPNPSPISSSPLKASAPSTLNRAIANANTPSTPEDPPVSLIIVCRYETGAVNAVVSKSNWDAIVRSSDTEGAGELKLELVLKDGGGKVVELKKEEDQEEDVKPDIKPDVKPELPHLRIHPRSPAPSPAPSLPSTSSPTEPPTTILATQVSTTQEERVSKRLRTSSPPVNSDPSTTSPSPPLLEASPKVEVVFYYRKQYLFSILGTLSSSTKKIRREAIKRLGWHGEDYFVFSVSSSRFVRYLDNSDTLGGLLCMLGEDEVFGEEKARAVSVDVYRPEFIEKIDPYLSSQCPATKSSLGQGAAQVNVFFCGQGRRPPPDLHVPCKLSTSMRDLWSAYTTFAGEQHRRHEYRYLWEGGPLRTGHYEAGLKVRDMLIDLDWTNSGPFVIEVYRGITGEGEATGEVDLNQEEKESHTL